MNDFILSRLEKYPEFLSSNDLVNLGLFPSPDAVYLSRYRGSSPNYIKIKKKILYPKHFVIEWINLHMRNGNIRSTEQ
jgi:hypothetical protein